MNKGLREQIDHNKIYYNNLTYAMLDEVLNNLNPLTMKKQLEYLYAWSDFYKQNQRYTDLEKCNKQIKEFKSKNNLE
jgi:hypothetical protein